MPLNKKKISPGWRGFLKPLFADFKIGNNIQFWEYWLLWFIEGKQYLAFKESMYCKSKNAAHNKIQIKQYKEKDVDKLNKTSWDNLVHTLMFERNQKYIYKVQQLNINQSTYLPNKTVLVILGNWKIKLDYIFDCQNHKM